MKSILKKILLKGILILTNLSQLSLKLSTILKKTVENMTQNSSYQFKLLIIKILLILKLCLYIIFRYLEILKNNILAVTFHKL